MVRLFRHSPRSQQRSEGSSRSALRNVCCQDVMLPLMPLQHHPLRHVCRWQMSKHSKQSFARTIQVSCCCPGLCRLCPFCAPSRTRLTPTTSPGFHGKAGHLKQMNKRLLNIADPGMIANCFAHCSLKVTQFSTNSLKQSSITKPLQKLFWPSSKPFICCFGYVGLCAPPGPQALPCKVP